MFYYRNSSIDYEARINYKNCVSSSLKTAAIFSDDNRGYDLVAGIDNKNASKLISNNNLVIPPPTSVRQPGFTMPTGDKTLVIKYKSINDASTSWVFGAPNNPRIILAEYQGKYQVYDGGWRNSKVVVEHDVYHTFAIVYKSGTGYLYKDAVLIHTWSNPYAGISSILFSAGATHKTLYIEFFYAFYKSLSFDEVKSLSESPYQILKPRRKWYYFVDTAGIQLLINPSREIASGNTFSSSKILGITNSGENSLTSQQGKEKTLLSNFSPETDTSFATFSVKEVTLSFSQEVDNCKPFSLAATTEILKATTAEIAKTVIGGKKLDIGKSSSLQSAKTLLSSKVSILGNTTENNYSKAISFYKLNKIAFGSESSSALSFSFSGTIILPKTLENSYATAITTSKILLSLDITETSSAKTLHKDKSLLLGNSLETDTSKGFLSSFLAGISLASSTETATNLLSNIYATLYPSFENVIVPGFTLKTLSWDYAVKTIKILKTSRTITIQNG